MTKVLRITVTHQSKIVEERVMMARETVTVGTDEKNTFQVRDHGAPATWAVFELAGSQYNLTYNADMSGHVSVKNQNLDFAALKAQNLSKAGNDRSHYLLDDSSKGQVQLSKDTTILFHFVDKPSKVVQKELPDDIKDGWMKRFEPILMLSFIGSFIFHTGAGITVVSVDPPPPPSQEELKQWIAKVAAPPPVEEEEKPEPEEEKKDEDKDSDKPADKPAPEEKPEEKPAEKEPPKNLKDAAKQAKAAEAKRQDVRNQIASKGLLAMIGAVGEGDGALANVFSDGAAIGGDLSDALAGTAGVGIAASGSGIARKGGGSGGGSAADIGSLGTSGGGKVKTKAKKRTKVSGRVSAADVEPLDGEIDSKAVKRILQRRGKMFQQCYETALKSNSKLKGKIVIEFTINSRGKVSDASAVKDSVGGGVGKCVVSAMKRIRFPKPDDGEVTIQNSFVFQPG